jgi:ParB family chromosome partitioning protein
MKRKMEFKIVDIDELVPNPFQPRERPDEELEALTESLKSWGDIQPIIVRKYEKGYQIIAGERRWRASKLAGLKKIPVLIRDTPDEDVLLESLIENLHRKDLSDPEREKAIYTLWESGRFKTKKGLANVLGIREDQVKADIEACEFRMKSGEISPQIPTYVIAQTRGLKEAERKVIIRKVEREEVKRAQVSKIARVVREAPPPVKKAILKRKSRITPRVAEKILELPEEKQEEVIKEIESLRLEEDEAISHIESRKLEIPPPIPPEKWEEIRERYKKLQEEVREKLDTPEAKERGKLFKNWTGHVAISGALESVFCPICSSKELGWLCHKLGLKEALDMAEEKYKESTGGRKDAHYKALPN